MKRVEKTVFISYRRSNAGWALAIFQALTQQGYDVFFDFEGIASGDFERIILENIRARAHFIVLLTPSALERCNDPGDWLRREIEEALETRRNIVPLMLEGFDFSTPSIGNQLTGRLAALKQYNALRVPADYFAEAIGRLREKFLNVPLDSVLHPASASALRAAELQQAAAVAAPAVAQEQLTAEEWFEQGAKALNARDIDEGIRCYNEAIRLNPDYADAFFCRGIAREIKEDFDDGPIADYTEAIRLEPDHADAFRLRGIARVRKGDLDGAIADFNEAIRLEPDHAESFYKRGAWRGGKGDFDGEIADYNEAIRLKPDYADAFRLRGIARARKGDIDGAIADYNEAIRLKPDYAEAICGRGVTRRSNGDLDGAIADFNEAIRLKPDYAEAICERGVMRGSNGDLDGAIADFNEAIRLKPDYAEAFYIRGTARKYKGDLTSIKDAIADLQQYLYLGGGVRCGNEAEVEQDIVELKKSVSRG